MGLEELLNSLRKSEQKQIADIWQAAEAEADSLREVIADEIASITKNHVDQLASACQKSVRTIFAEAETRVREKKLFSYQKLEKSLRGMAVNQLPMLREEKYKEVFAFLVEELPERQWDEIIVNPADLELATEFFDTKIIRSEEAICGGMIAVAAQGNIIVDNTFRKRLERKWFHILPRIIKEIEKRHGKKEFPENS